MPRIKNKVEWPSGSGPFHVLMEGFTHDHWVELVRGVKSKWHRIDEAEIEDAVQTVMMRLYRRGHVEIQGLKNLLFASTFNVLKDNIKAQKYWKMLEISDAVESTEPQLAYDKEDVLSSMMNVEQVNCVVKAMQSITDHQRTVFHMKYFEDMTYEEIAQKIGGKSTAHKMTASRARTQIQQLSQLN